MRIALVSLATLALTLASPAPSRADDDDNVPPVRDPLTRKECGECHMAFQPAFLPARSWEAIMKNLSDHFGEDASLPEDKTRAIRDYLVANAGYPRRLAPNATPLRITETPGFLREHRFSEAEWRKPSVGSKSNCPACHQGAEAGIYDDDDD